MQLKKGINLIVTVVGIALFSTEATLADVTVKYKVTSDRDLAYQIVKYADKNHVRSEFWSKGKESGVMLKLDDKVYMIADGKVIDLSGGLGASMAKMFGSSKKIPKATFEATGRRERIAGITGEVYRVIQDGSVHEVVLGRNSDLSDVEQAMMAFPKGMMGKSNSSLLIKQSNQDSSIKGLSLLRFDHALELVSIKIGRISDVAFSLPRSAAKDGTQEVYPSDKSSEAESIIKKDAKDIANNTVDEAHQSTKQGIQNGISNEIEKGIGDLINGVFGR